MGIIAQYQNELMLSLVVIMFFQLLWIFVLSLKVRKTKKRLIRFTRGDGTQNLGQLIEQYNQEIDGMKLDLQKNKENIELLMKKFKNSKGKIAMVRYNGFGEQGNDLSFSLAILDENKNGVVITSIYNREQSNAYAKPIEQGKSNYRLSEEELKVIDLAMNS